MTARIGARPGVVRILFITAAAGAAVGVLMGCNYFVTNTNGVERKRLLCFYAGGFFPQEGRASYVAVCTYCNVVVKKNGCVSPSEEE